MKVEYKNRLKSFAGHGESDVKNSWYWSVLVKNLGSYKKAKESIKQSRRRVDPTYNY